MAYGLKISNPDGEMVISSDGFGMNYIGRATYTGTSSISNFLPPYYNPPFATFINVGVYTITSTSDAIMPFLPINSSYITGVVTCKKTNSNTWQISVINHAPLASTATPSNMPAWTQTDVYVFAKPTGTGSGSGYGLEIFNSSGSLTWDFKSSQPLYFKGRAKFTFTGAGSDTQVSIPSSAQSTTTLLAFGWGLGKIDPYLARIAPPLVPVDQPY